MRASLLLLLALACAACAESRPSAPNPREPVSVYLRSGEFVRAEYVDSAWAASPDIATEARTRALGLLRRYGTPGLDSVVVRVSNRAEVVRDVGPKSTSNFRFTRAELGAAAPSAEAADDPSRPVELEMRSGYVRAVYVDPVLAAGLPSQDGDARMRALGRQILRQLGTEADSVTIAITDGARPEHRRVSSTFAIAVLREP
jgi:hypothetical protein